MKSITVRYIVPCNHMLFCRWLPNGEEYILVKRRGNLSARLWIDYSCVEYPGETIDEEKIQHWNNVTVDKMFIDVEVDNLSDELVNFIYDEYDSPRQVHYGLKPGEGNYEGLLLSYKELGIQVQEFAVNFYNRLIAFARNQKLQHWLEAYIFDKDNVSSIDNKFKAQVRSEGRDWVRWCPYNEIHFRLSIPSDDIIIKQEEWGRITEYVAGNSRPWLPSELLANARVLLDSDHRRSAILEAISALEIAISEFSKKPILDGLLSDEATERIDIRHLAAQVDHLGVTGTLRYLLPILFPSSVLQTDVLNKTQEAIALRHNLVHNKHGQRDVDDLLARQLVSAVIAACQVIFKYTDHS